ncbi:MAG: sigma-70 family RNA polymerase sigma factor [Alphaproteobacteria bacterium]|nr:sigma-70 family RNA polymerase sigma factor [Alphaproteobacteria bacterium]
MNKREKTILDNLGLVYSAASKKSWPLDFNERVSIGCESLIKAIDTYDPNRGSSLSSHFYRHFHSDLIDANKRNHNPRNMVSFDAPLSRTDDSEEKFTLHDVVAADVKLPLDVVVSKETSKRLWTAVGGLPPKWKGILMMRYVDNGGMSQRDVARKIGKSKSWVLKEERRALCCCRRVMEC